MELRQLITFRTIVEVGGFKRAAERLDYAQSSITTHIKQLEKELGSPVVPVTEIPWLPLSMCQLIKDSKVLKSMDPLSSKGVTIGATEPRRRCFTSWIFKPFTLPSTIFYLPIPI